jgi:hypothetical protein
LRDIGLHPIFADRVLEAIRSAKPRLVLYLRNGDILRVRGDILVRSGEPIPKAAWAVYCILALSVAVMCIWLHR